jgi:hypothetical protein
MPGNEKYTSVMTSNARHESFAITRGRVVRRILLYHFDRFLLLALMGFPWLYPLVPRGVLLTSAGLAAVVVLYSVWTGLRHYHDPVSLDLIDGTFVASRLEGSSTRFQATQIAEVRLMSYRFGSGRNYWVYYRILLTGARTYVYIDRLHVAPRAAAVLETMWTDDGKGFSY